MKFPWKRPVRIRVPPRVNRAEVDEKGRIVCPPPFGPRPGMAKHVLLTVHDGQLKEAGTAGGEWFIYIATWPWRTQGEASHLGETPARRRGWA